MNILIITNSFYPKFGGITHTLMNLNKFIKRSKHDLVIVNPYCSGKNIYGILKLTQSKFPKIFTMPFDFLRNFINLSIFLNKMDFDIIMSGNSDWSLLVLVSILSKIFKKKLILMAHGNDFLIRHHLPINFSFKTFFFKKADKIIISNKTMKKFIKEIHHLNENKLEIIHRAVNPIESQVKESKEELRKKFEIPPDYFIILSIGRHVPRKNFDFVIKAINKIKEIRPELKIRYYLMGSGPTTDNLKKLSEKLKLKKEVIFLGNLDTQKRNKFYKLSDLFVMPSIVEKNTIEGFGIVFIEANFYKVPTIGTFSGGVVEAIENGKTGFLIKTNDLDALVEKIVYFIEYESERQKMGHYGYSRVMDEFTWNKIIDQYINIFEQIIEN